MKEQKINVELVKDTADRLRSFNLRIDEDFLSMMQTLSRLCRDWNSPAGDKAQEVISELGRNNEVRSGVLQNYANVLDKYVAVNYINTEDANISMADQFE